MAWRRFLTSPLQRGNIPSARGADCLRVPPAWSPLRASHAARRARRGLTPLHGRVAVVTGAAQGLGCAIAHELARRGCRVALVDIDADALEHVRAALHGGHSRPDAPSPASGAPAVSVHVADVVDAVRMHQVARDVLAAHGEVHLLVNNAGVAYEAPFQLTPLDAWEQVLRVNLHGVIQGCHAFLPLLARADRGWIVNVSSLLGLAALPGQSAYAASKFAVRGFSEALREELRGTSVGLTLVHPGAIATGIMRRAAGSDADVLARVDAWYQRHAMPAEQAAARIADAVERGTPRLLIGHDARFADALARLMPVAGARLFAEATIRVLGLGDMRARRAAQWQRMVDGEDRHDP